MDKARLALRVATASAGRWGSLLSQAIGPFCGRAGMPPLLSWCLRSRFTIASTPFSLRCAFVGEGRMANGRTLVRAGEIVAASVTAHELRRLLLSGFCRLARPIVIVDILHVALLRQ